MFGASVLVPLLFGINSGIVLFMNGLGTLLFIFLTKGKAPAYLGATGADLSDGKHIAVFLVTLGVAIFGSVLFRKFFSVIPMLIAMVAG